MATYKIAVLPGDGIGTEIINEAVVNGRDKVSQKWSFKSEPLWKGYGIHCKVTNLISLWLINPSLREEIALKKRRPFWTYCCSLEEG
jgi:isocitrate/isopropylmalate dehydrogenase